MASLHWHNRILFLCCGVFEDFYLFTARRECLYPVGCSQFYDEKENYVIIINDPQTNFTVSDETIYVARASFDWALKTPILQNPRTVQRKNVSCDVTKREEGNYIL